MHIPAASTSGRLKFTARPVFLLAMTAALLGPAAYIHMRLERTLEPYRQAHRLVAEVRWMPWYADLKFFREIEGASGTRHTLLVYQARGEVLRSALDRIPIRRLERWRPAPDSGTLAALAFLADTLRLPPALLPIKSSGRKLLYCHSPFEAPEQARHRSFALADTALGMVWIGRSLSAGDAPFLAQEAFYQMSNSGFAAWERSDLSRKIGYLESRAPTEPGLYTLLALRHTQDAYRFGSPFQAASFGEGALGRAIELQEKSVRMDPGYCLGYARLARYHAILEDYAPARDDLKRAAACGEDIHYLAAKALYHFKRGESDSSRALVARIEQGDFPEKGYYPYEEIVRAQMREDGDLDAAEKIHQRLILHAPDLPQPYGNFAEYLLGEYRFDAAAVLCDRLKDLGGYPIGDRTCEEADRKQKRYGDRKGLAEKTRQWAERLRSGEDPVPILKERIGTLAAAGLESLALEDLDSLSARAPAPDLAALQVDLLARLGDRIRAREDCRDFSRVYAHSAALALACGKLEYHWGHADTARAYLLRSRKEDSASGAAALYLGYLLDGDSAEAARKALALDPQLAEAHAVLGHSLLRSGNDSEALAHLERALGREPGNLEWLAWHGQALAQAGKPEAALPDLNRVLRRVRGHAEALRARILAYQDLGAIGLAWADGSRLLRSGSARPEDSAGLREWVSHAAMDTAALDADPLYKLRSGFTRNVLQGKAVDRPERLSLKAMQGRRVYLRMHLEQAAGKRYDLTYAIKDGKGRTAETGSLPISVNTDHYSLWFSHEFGRPDEAPGDWMFNLYRKGELVAAESMRMDP